MGCFSLSFLQQLIIWVIVIAAIVARNGVVECAWAA